MNIIQDLIPKGKGNRPGYPMKPQFVTVHDVGNKNKGAGAANHAKYLKGAAAAKAPVSWHFTVDDKQIVQHLPTNEVGWHAGDGASGPGNRTSIGVEITENADSDRAKAEANAAWLVADLLHKHSLDITKVVQHNRWTGKNCPAVLRGRKNGWEEFIVAVKINLADKQVKPTDVNEEELASLHAEIAQLKRERDAAIAEVNRLKVVINQIHSITKKEVQM